MKAGETMACAREQEVLDLIAIAQWPARADTSLRAHVTTCAVCGDLALVAAALRAQAHENDAPVRVPDAAVVWYGARLLARTEHARRAARPVLVVQAVALACVLAAAAAGWRLVGGQVVAWLGGLMPESWPAWSDVEALATDGPRRWRWLAAGVTAWMVLVPLAFYLVRVADRGGETETGRSRL